MTTLTPHQRAAVECSAPRILLRAPAGSGKTATLVERVARLLTGGWHPAEVLCLTFTRAASAEMRERVEARLDGQRIRSLRRLTVTTFHAWAARTIREYADRLGMDAAFTIRDEQDRDDLTVFAGRELGKCPAEGAKPRAGQWKSPRRLWQEDDVRDRYRRLMREANAVDYDGLEILLRRLLGLPDVAAELRRRWRHVLVDEYQDTSAGQQAILDALAADNLFVVGDSAQSIYGFRGAHVGGCVDLAERPDWTTLALPDNFRSLPPIVAAANRLAAAMAVPGVEMVATRGTDLPPDLDHLSACPREAPTPEDLHAIIAGEIATRLGSWRDCAILAPTWSALDPVAEALTAAGVPSRLARRAFEAWDSEEARWAVACLRVAANPRDHLALFAALNGFAVRVGMGEWARARAASLRAEAPVFDVVATEHPAAAAPIIAAISNARALGEGVHPFEWVHETCSALAPEFRRLHLESRSFAAFEDAVMAWSEKTSGATIRDFLDFYAARHVDGAAVKDDDEDAVTLTTIHGAKGREWPAVWLLGWQDGCLPRPGADVEESRRLAYVAVTRARDRLRICLDTSTHPSRFVAEALGDAMPTPEEPRIVYDDALPLSPARYGAVRVSACVEIQRMIDASPLAARAMWDQSADPVAAAWGAVLTVAADGMREPRSEAAVRALDDAVARLRHALEDSP